jgi:GntR family transcriptional regulator
MLVVDLRSRVPIYEQIKNQIMELIVVGALKPHDPLPSIRALASQLDLNFNTVKRAFSDLETDGVVYTAVGRGTFVAEGAMDNELIRARAASRLREALRAARASGLTRGDIIALAQETFLELGKDGNDVD